MPNNIYIKAHSHLATQRHIPNVNDFVKLAKTFVLYGRRLFVTEEPYSKCVGIKSKKYSMNRLRNILAELDEMLIVSSCVSYNNRYPGDSRSSFLQFHLEINRLIICVYIPQAGSGICFFFLLIILKF